MLTPCAMHSLQVAMWEQCGDVNGPTRGLMCPADSQCAYANQWWWQCQPKAGAPGRNHGGMCKSVRYRIRGPVQPYS